MGIIIHVYCTQKCGWALYTAKYGILKRQWMKRWTCFNHQGLKTIVPYDPEIDRCSFFLRLRNDSQWLELPDLQNLFLSFRRGCWLKLVCSIFKLRWLHKMKEKFEGSPRSILVYSTINVIGSRKIIQGKSKHLEKYAEVVNGNRCQRYMNEKKRGNSTKRFLQWSIL